VTSISDGIGGRSGRRFCAVSLRGCLPVVVVRVDNMTLKWESAVKCDGQMGSLMRSLTKHNEVCYAGHSTTV
jgi:hypothetical protein